MSKEPITTPSAESLAVEAEAARGGDGLPPVEDWDPPLSGDIDIRIARDGTWYHEGTVIERRGLVKVFSTILKREGDEFFLVTPVEKWRITVEDAPFLAVDVETEDKGDAQRVTFETNVGDRVVASEDHPIRVERNGETGEPAPYVLVRRNLEALIDRKSFYRMVDAGAHHDGWFGVWSAGAFFRIIPSQEMDV